MWKLETLRSRAIDIISVILTRAYYLTLGYPRFSYTEEHLKSLEIPENEVEINRTYVMKPTLTQVLSVLLFFVLSMKEIQFPLYTLYVMDQYEERYPTELNNYEQGRTYSTELNQTHKFACMETNCPFVRDLISIPVYYLCKPKMRSVTNPIVHLHVLGIILETLVSFAYFVFGVLLPLYYYFLPPSQLLATFLMMTATTQRSLCEFVRKQIMYIELSTINYCDNVRELLQSSHMVDQNYEEAYIEWHLIEGTKQMRALNKPFIRLSKRAKNYISDCLTVYRSNWWQTSTKEHFVVVYGFIFLTYCNTGLVVLYIINIMQDARQIELEAFDERIATANCAIWYTKTYKSIKLANDIKFDFSLYSMVELSVCMTFIVFVMAYNLALMVQAVQDLKFQIIEQMDRIRLTIEMTEILKIFSGESFKSKGFDIELCSESDPFKQLCQMHRKNFNGFYIFRYLNPFRTNTLMEPRSTYEDKIQIIIIEELLEKRDIDFDSYLSSLVKLHVGLKTLAKIIRDYSADTNAVLAFCSIIGLGFVVIMIYFKSRFTDLSTILALCVVAGLIAYNVLILIPSSVHATSRHLLILMWRLIASQAHFKDIRLRHLRLLLIRQTVLLCNDDGLSLKAFNSPVTYAFIIKIIIWTSSLLLLSTSR